MQTMVNFVVKAIVEVMGTPKEHVDQTLNLVLKKIKDERKFKIRSEKIFDGVPVEGKPMWTGFMELELELKKFEQLTDFCFQFYPSSIEIIEPENLNIHCSDFSTFFNDLAARLHKTHELMRDIHAANKLLVKEVDRYKAAVRKK